MNHSDCLTRVYTYSSIQLSFRVSFHVSQRLVFSHERALYLLASCNFAIPSVRLTARLGREQGDPLSLRSSPCGSTRLTQCRYTDCKSIMIRPFIDGFYILIIRPHFKPPHRRVTVYPIEPAGIYKWVGV